MANVQHNPATQNISGNVGNLRFRKRRDGTFSVSHIPERRSTPPTAAQTAVKERFAKAGAYATRALALPEVRAAYEKLAEREDLTPRSAAVRDWFRPPSVVEIVLDGYTGLPGSVIEVLARDDARVESVTVTLRRKSDDSVIEAGPAAFVAGAWAYQATQAVPAGEAVVVEAKAKDRPGNTGELTAEWPLEGGVAP